MPRGRHRHSPPLHRLLPPTAIAGVSLVCALGPWVFAEQSVLRVSAAVAAATAAVGAAVMRRWDVEAGKRVADLTRARAGDEWRHEEKAAELETDLEESRELRTKLEHKLRAKRTELANLRNEHAALLRRYATAETERASALEGRRLLETETTAPGAGRALAAGSGAGEASAGAGTFAQASLVPPRGVPAPGVPWEARGSAAAAGAGQGSSAAGAVRASAGGAVAASGDDGARTGEGDAEGIEVTEETKETEKAGKADGSGEKVSAGVFSPAGSSLFLRAHSALERIITQRAVVKEAVEADSDSGSGEAAGVDAEAGAGSEVEAEVENVVEAGNGVEADEGEAAAGVEERQGAGEVQAEAEAEEVVGEEADAEVGGEAVDQVGQPSDDASGGGRGDEPAEGRLPQDGADKHGSTQDGSGEDGAPKGDPDGPTGGGSRQGRPREVEAEPVPVVVAVEEGGPAERDGLSAVRYSGHFTVPTAVAVVPAAPRRRAKAEGGFDFFGTQSGAEAIEAMRNEDLADVIGQEALALHKAESEAEFKRVDEASRGIGQVIDLTAHDETEQIDLTGLRTAAF